MDLIADFVDASVEVKMSFRSNAQSTLFLAGVFSMLTSCSRVAAKTNADQGDDILVRAVPAVVQDVPREVTCVGTAEAAERVDVKSRVAGQVKRVTFEEGQSVSKGQLLFTIDREALDRQAAELEAELVRDEAMEKQARAIVSRDAAAQKQSQTEAEVAAELGKLGVLSGQRVDQLSTAWETATAGLRSDQAAVEAADAARKADQARLAETQLQLGFTNVVAPVAGRAGAAMVKVGNIVRDDDTTLVTLVQLTPIYVTFGIPEQLLPQVQKLNALNPLTVEASYGGGPIQEGHLAFIDNAVDSTTGTIRLKAIFANEGNALWPGEFVRVRLRLSIDAAKIVIPNASIQDGINGKYTWRVESGQAEMTPVTVIRTWIPEDGPELAVIGNGLRPGDLVVTEGQLKLTPGARVSFLNATRETTVDDSSLAP
jgi:membrane fusion protein, multidrug efflux system